MLGAVLTGSRPRGDPMRPSFGMRADNINTGLENQRTLSVSKQLTMGLSEPNMQSGARGLNRQASLVSPGSNLVDTDVIAAEEAEMPPKVKRKPSRLIKMNSKTLPQGPNVGIPLQLFESSCSYCPHHEHPEKKEIPPQRSFKSSKSKAADSFIAFTKLKLNYQRLPMSKVNRLKRSSGMAEIVEASSHDFSRPPVFANGAGSSSSSGSAFHESKLINTPIEAQSLENSTERGKQVPIDNSPRLLDLIQRQDQTIFQVEGTHTAEQNRYQSPLNRSDENLDKKFMDLQVTNQESLGMKFDSPREHKKVESSVKKLGSPVLRHKKQSQLVVPASKHISFAERAEALSKTQPAMKKRTFEEEKSKLEVSRQCQSEKSQFSPSVKLWGMSIDLNSSPPLSPLRKQASTCRQSVILRRQLRSNERKNLNDMLSAERFTQIEKFSPKKEGNYRDNLILRRQDQSRDVDQQSEEDGVIIVPLRRARSLKVIDPLKRDELYQKYLKDNESEASIFQGDTWSFPLVREGEKALIIENLARINQKENEKAESQQKQKSNEKNKTRDGAIKISAPEQVTKDLLNGDQSSSQTSSFDFSEEEADPEEYERKKEERRKEKALIQERARKQKEERQSEVNLIKNKEGSYYSQIFKQRGLEFTTMIQRFDATLANSIVMKKMEQKITVKRRQKASGGSLRTIFTRRSFSLKNNVHHDIHIDGPIDSVITLNPDLSQQNSKRLIRAHSYLDITEEIEDETPNASSKPQDKDLDENWRKNKRDDPELMINTSSNPGCHKQQEVSDLIDCKIDFTTLKNLQRVKLKRRMREEIRQQEAQEEHMTSNYKVFDHKNRIKDKLQHSNQLQIEDYRDTQDKDAKLKNQNKIMTDDFGEEAFKAGSIVEAIKEARLLHPHSVFAKGWQVLLLIALLYCATLMPYKVCFIEEHSTGWLVFDTTIDFIFISDIIIVLNTPFIDVQTQQIVLSRKRIFVRYLKGWLLIDLASSIPLDMILYLLFGEMQNMQLNNDLLKLLRVPRIYRVMRVARLFRVIKLFQNMPLISKIKDTLNLKIGSQRMLEFAVTTFVMVHLVACFWYFIAAGEPPETETWLVANDLQHETYGSKYLASMYWGYTTMLTVGYGDITPKTNKEYIFAMIWMIMGAGIYTQVIGNLASVLATLDTRESAIQDKISTVDEFCKEAKISGPLRTKLKEAIEYSTGKNFFSWVDKQQILSELPAAIRCEISLHMHGGIVKKINFFQDKDQTFIGQIVPLLQPCNARKDDMVYAKSQHSSAIFFITKGRVSFCLEEESDIAYLDMIMGSYFGEIEVIQNIPRLFSVKASEFTHFLTLSKQVFELYLMNEYPATFEEMTKVAILRREKITVAQQLSLDIVERVQYHDISNMKTEDFERLIKPQSKESKQMFDKIVTKRSNSKTIKQKTMKAAKFKKSQSLQAISRSKVHRQKFQEKDSDKISNSFSFEDSASSSQSESSGSSNRSDSQENSVHSSVSQQEEEKAQTLKDTSAQNKHKSHMQKQTENKVSDSDPFNLQEVKRHNSHSENILKSQIKDNLLSLLGEGVLENLEQSMEAKQMEEQKKLQEQQKEVDRRFQMLKQLNKIKMQKMLKRDTTLESIVDSNFRVGSILQGSIAIEQSHSQIQNVIQDDLKNKFLKIKKQAIVESNEAFTPLIDKRTQFANQRLPSQMTPVPPNLAFQASARLKTHDQRKESYKNLTASSATVHDLKGENHNSGMSMQSFSHSPDDKTSNPQKQFTFGQSQENKEALESIALTSNQVESMQKQLKSEIQQTDEVDAKVDDLLQMLKPKIK